MWSVSVVVLLPVCDLLARLTAWRRDTGFHVKSSLTVGDTFFASYAIRKADPRGHLVLYDTSQSRRVAAGGGINRMTRAFLLPIWKLEFSTFDGMKGKH